MLINGILRAAQPYLQGKSVVDAVIGISLIAVQLSDGSVGVSYVLREDLEAGCSIFPYGQQVIGHQAEGIADWAATGRDSLQKAIGVAVLGAAAGSQQLPDAQTPEQPYGVAVTKKDSMGLIGYIPAVVKMAGAKAGQLYIFDKGISERGGEGAGILPTQEQSRLLPACDVVFISGTAVINGSIDQLLTTCANARDIVIIGAWTPMFPAAFAGTNVSILAGSLWKNDQKEAIFKKISLACGISALSPYSLKQTVPVGPLARTSR